MIDMLLRRARFALPLLALTTGVSVAPAVAAPASGAHSSVRSVHVPRPLPVRPGRTNRPRLRPVTTATAADAPPLTFARYFFGDDSLNPPATQAARWPLLIAQGDKKANAARVKQADPTHVQTIVYADPLFVRATDPDGVTTATDNADTLARHPEWVLRDASGAMVRAKNFGNQDYAADIGNPAYQQASITFLLAKIRADGWDGVFLDDTNPTPDYTFATRPSAYPTDAQWQSAETAYVAAVCGAIQAAGHRCYLNLNAMNTSWARGIAARSDGPMTEFFVAMDPSVGGRPQLASIENGYWLPQITWATWLEANTRQQIAHASSSDGPAVDYALASFLLVAQGHGAFAANRSYTNMFEGLVPTSATTDASRLGPPLGPYVVDAGGVYHRAFTHGSVVVNPHDAPRSYAGAMYPATSGTLTVTG